MKLMRIGCWSIVCAVALCGCGHSHSSEAKSYQHYKPGDGAIDLNAGEVVIRAGGQANDAHVAADGGLKLGQHEVDINDKGRAALRQYYVAAASFREHALALGIAGAHFGVHAAERALRGMFDDKGDAADHAEAEADKGSDEIVQRALELCDRVRDAYVAQNAAAVAVPEFEPYAVISAKQVKQCNDDRKSDPAADHPAQKSDSQA